MIRFGPPTTRVSLKLALFASCIREQCELGAPPYFFRAASMYSWSRFTLSSPAYLAIWS